MASNVGQSDATEAVDKPPLSVRQIINMAVGFFGIQVAFALQIGNASRIFQTLGSNVTDLAVYWLAGPLTGLIIQPIVGHLSDNTWTRFGRRRPFFVAGAMWAAVALFVMPRTPELWFAVASLWILDAAINVSMEPFRAFVGDLLPARQRTRGYAFQTIFIGVGGFIGSWMPWTLTQLGISNQVIDGGVPDNVVWSFAIGGVLLVSAVMWTVLTTKEYAPDVAARFNKAELDAEGDDFLTAVAKPSKFFWLWGFASILLGTVVCYSVWRFGFQRESYVLGGLIAAIGLMFCLRALLPTTKNMVTSIIDDVVAMPRVMKQLAVVQFFSWGAFYIMWSYSQPAIAERYFGTANPDSQMFQAAGDWIGILTGIYFLVSAAYALLIPAIAGKLGLRKTHALGLICGALGFASYLVFTDKNMLILSVVFIGIAWGSILTMPYSILSNGIPPQKMGIYMGIFNFFIVLPQLFLGTILGTLLENVFDRHAMPLFGLGVVSLLIAAACLARVDSTKHRREHIVSE